MLHHFATVDAQGFAVVAYHSPQGGAVGVCQCNDDATAASMAARLNAEGAARDAMNKYRGAQPRRHLRYFEEDQYA